MRSSILVCSDKVFFIEVFWRNFFLSFCTEFNKLIFRNLTLTDFCFSAWFYSQEKQSRSKIWQYVVEVKNIASVISKKWKPKKQHMQITHKNSTHRCFEQFRNNRVFLNKFFADFYRTYFNEMSSFCQSENFRDSINSEKKFLRETLLV